MCKGCLAKLKRALLFPSLYWLIRVFKRGPAFAPLDEGDGDEG